MIKSGPGGVMRVEWLAKHIEVIGIAVVGVALLIAYVVSRVWGLG
jgi:hypothetical protein